jgi:hypothetical protein
MHPQPNDWLAYFRRTFPATAGFDDYEQHMKYGVGQGILERFRFRGLRESPGRRDLSRRPAHIPEGRPHSQISERDVWKGPDFVHQR